MSALRWLVLAATASLAACASAPPPAGSVTVYSVAPASVATPRTGDRPAAPPAPPATLTKLARRLRKDIRAAVVFTEKGDASDAVVALKRAGLEVVTEERDFRYVGGDPKWGAYDLVVVDKKPDNLVEKHASALGERGTPVVATWTEDVGDAKARPVLELVERRADGTLAHYAIWRPRDWVLDGKDLAAAPPTPSGFSVGEDGSATIVGRPCEAAEGTFLEVAAARTHVLLTGEVTKKLEPLVACANRDLDAKAAVRARARFAEHRDGVTVWIAEVDDIRFDVGVDAMRALEKRHAAHYDRAVRHVERGELAAAATKLDEAAKVFEDAFAGLGEVASRKVRFDREMARRLREVSTRGGGAQALIDRVATFSSYDPAENDLVVAAVRLARAKLIRDYRSAKTVEDAELAARIYACAVLIHMEGYPPIFWQMRERFPSMRFDRYKPPPFRMTGDPNIED